MTVFSAAVSWFIKYVELLVAVLVGTFVMGASEVALSVSGLCD